MWVALIVVIITLIVKLTDDEPERKLSAAKVAKHELKLKEKAA